jgi:hypothetical protein
MRILFRLLLFPNIGKRIEQRDVWARNARDVKRKQEKREESKGERKVRKGK